MTDVNRENCTALHAMLSTNPRRHDQRVYLRKESQNECGTAGCIAGWANLAYRGLVTIAENGTMEWTERDDDPLYGYDRQSYRFGQLWLGLEPNPAHLLFIETTNYIESRRLALELLRRLGDGRLDNVTLTWHAFNDVVRELGLPVNDDHDDDEDN